MPAALLAAALLAAATSPVAGGCTLQLALVDGVLVPGVRIGYHRKVPSQVAMFCTVLTIEYGQAYSTPFLRSTPKLIHLTLVHQRLATIRAKYRVILMPKACAVGPSSPPDPIDLSSSPSTTPSASPSRQARPFLSTSARDRAAG